MKQRSKSPKRLRVSEKATLTNSKSEKSLDENKTKSKKRVRFAKEVRVAATVPALESLTAEERFEQWWTKEEFHTIKVSAKFITSSLRKYKKSTIAEVDHALSNSLRLTCTVNDDGLAKILEDPEQYGTSLDRWNDDALPSRGLEKYASNKQRSDRTDLAKMSRCKVLDMLKSDKATVEEIATYYREYSKASTLFARFMGASDAKAARGLPVMPQKYEPVLPPPVFTSSAKMISARCPATASAASIIVRQISPLVEYTVLT
jgi:hypothetical protein